MCSTPTSCRGNLHARMAKDHEQVLALDDKTYVLDSRHHRHRRRQLRPRHRRHHGRHGHRQFEDTKNVFIESAWFDPARIARAGRKQGIISDARYRFERGVDPQFVLPGLELCTQLILEWCGGEAIGCGDRGRTAAAAQAYRFRSRLVETLGGIQIAARAKSSRILRRPGLHGGGPWRHPACDAAQLAP